MIRIRVSCDTMRDLFVAGNGFHCVSGLPTTLGDLVDVELETGNTVVMIFDNGDYDKIEEQQVLLTATTNPSSTPVKGHDDPHDAFDSAMGIV
jgi:hypothetical protein